MAGANKLFNEWGNVTSDFRNDLVFADRNQKYGAYALRKNYNRAYSISLLITISAFSLGFGIPKLMSAFKDREEIVANDNTQLDLTPPPPLDEKEPEPPPPPPPPPPPAQEMVKFTPPVVVDEPIPDDEIPPPQEKLNETQTGEKTQEGTGEETIIIPDETGTGEQVIEAPKVEKTFISVEQMPEFKGGDAAMSKFLSENLEYPEQAKNEGVEGTVHLKFTVTKDGSIKDITILNKDKLGYGCEEAAIAVIRKMPKWTPGRQNGEPVAVYFNIPIRFRLM